MGKEGSFRLVSQRIGIRPAQYAWPLLVIATVLVAGTCLADVPADAGRLRAFLDSDHAMTELQMAEIQLETIATRARDDQAQEIELRHANDPVVPSFPDMQKQGRADAVHGDLLFQQQEARRIQGQIATTSELLKSRMAGIDSWLATCQPRTGALGCGVSSEDIASYRDRSRDARKEIQKASLHARSVNKAVGAHLGEGGTLLTLPAGSKK